MQPNINFLWAALMVEELRRLGVEYFFLSPGSRSAPLLFTAGQHPGIRSIVHFDERALAFMAGGYVAASGKPAALICTSGTAAANFLPGIIEASKKKLPLVVITADRPPELQKTGAAQCIDQSGLFGGYVRWSFDMPCPTMDIAPEFVLTTADQALSRAKGEIPGPVHLNMMFREPLAPARQLAGLPSYISGSRIKRWEASGSPYTFYASHTSKAHETSVADLVIRLGRIKNGLILAGKLGTTADRQAVLRFAERTGFPVLADIASGLRLGEQHPQLIPFYDRALASRGKLPEIDGVIHFGGRMTSKHCADLIAGRTVKEYLMVLAHPLRSDPQHLVSARYCVPPGVLIDQILPLLPKRDPSSALKFFQQVSLKAAGHIDRAFAVGPLSEPGVARIISRLIPQGQGLFVSNSMPVRDMDSYASPLGNQVALGANRGASGIDGIVSSAIGFAEGLERPTTLLIGDLAFLYDLNALALLAQTKKKLVIVVINNDGGGIFSLLPAYEKTEVFRKCFTAPHGITFRHAAALFGLAYAAPASLPSFALAYRRALRAKGPALIEVKVPRRK